MRVFARRKLEGGNWAPASFHNIPILRSGVASRPLSRAAEWTYSEPNEEAWCYVLSQDFSNMAAVQQGMKSFGFSGPKPNPYMERSVANLHRNLAKYMGTGAPRELK